MGGALCVTAADGVLRLLSVLSVRPAACAAAVTRASSPTTKDGKVIQTPPWDGLSGHRSRSLRVGLLSVAAVPEL